MKFIVHKYKNSVESPGKFTSPHPQYYECLSEDLILYPKEIIGRGAFGIVFRGKYKDQTCAVKVLRDVGDEVQLSLPIASQTEVHFMKAFKSECELLERLSNDNIVRHLATEEYHKANHHLVLVLELMDCNLRQFFTSTSGKTLSFQTQRKLCRDIASALHYLHYHKIVHRDLCSDNVLLDCKEPIPVAKVCDFGMSKIVDNRPKSISLLAIGRRGFLPPEASDMKLTKHHPSFDIFSFGAIMVQIIQRVPIIESAKQRTSELNKIRTNHPLKRIIEKCLRPDKKDRPSAAKIRKEL